jgi:hypothetical protein
MTKVLVPIWKPRGLYGVKATWTSRFRAEIDEWAKDSDGRANVVSSLVVLYPDKDNAADPNAILITTPMQPPKLLGYLPREQAAEYRQRMAEAGFAHMISACEATLTGGLDTGDRSYDYVLELDLDMSEAPHPEHLVVNPQTVRRPAIPPFEPDEQGVYRFKCWLPHDAVGFLHPMGRTKGWTTDGWDTINYYLANAKGIGLGFKVLSVPKADHIRVFGEAPVNAVIEDIKQRWVVLRLER